MSVGNHVLSAYQRTRYYSLKRFFSPRFLLFSGRQGRYIYRSQTSHKKCGCSRSHHSSHHKKNLEFKIQNSMAGRWSISFSAVFLLFSQPQHFFLLWFFTCHFSLFTFHFSIIFNHSPLPTPHSPLPCFLFSPFQRNLPRSSLRSQTKF